MLQVLIQSGNQSEMVNLLKVSEASNNEIKSFIKSMRRRLPAVKADLSPSEPLIRFELKDLEKLMDVNKTIQLLLKIFYISSRQGLQQSDPEAGIPSAKLLNLLKEAIGKNHALKRYDQFALNTSCFWGNTIVLPLGAAILPLVL